MQAIEGKVNTWFETKAIFEKLDRTGLELDALFFRHPFFFGMAGAIVSFLIITLSVANLNTHLVTLLITEVVRFEQIRG